MEQTQNERATLTVLETARLLGISRGLCYEMARQGRLPTLLFGKRILIGRVALERMLNGAGNSNAIEDGLHLKFTKGGNDGRG